ncbi:MAG: FAD-dependent monooxygenase [Crocinitomicaceae bacterium]|nr:FAD-dependent monooxygenase [Crocinitomicaceae bacterium]
MEYDLIVVGAGVAGGVFAASQPKNKKILVVERDLTEPDRIIGELMQPGGVKSLEDLNLSHLIENIDARPVEGYKLIKGDKTFTIYYDEVSTGAKGVGLRNGKFLTNIRKELASLENVTVVQGNVTGLIEENDQIFGVSYTTDAGESVVQRAQLTVVCDGPMSLLRGKLSSVNKKISSYFMGLVLRDLDLEFPDHGHMILTGDAPMMVYPIHTNAYRILVDYPGGKAPKMGAKSIEKFKIDIAKNLPEDMVASFLKAMDEGDIKVMPNHNMKGQAFRKKGAVLLGDSLNMRHPVTGGGMTAVFADVICLNGALGKIDLSNEAELNTAVQSYYETRGKGVETINILANALYEVFRDNDLKEACFEYLQKGGEQAAGPLSIMAGLNKNKKELLKHFFKVAMQHPMHFVTKPGKQLRLYKNATGIIRPILKDEGQPALV